MTRHPPRPVTMPNRPCSRAVIILLAAEALLALGHARMILHRTRPEDVVRRNRAADRGGKTLSDRAVLDGCERIAFVIPRLAARLPWRADCLVQALAGQRMLLRRGIASEIAVGTARGDDGTFAAHAWLTCRGRVVLGGDIARFAPLIEPAADSPESR